MSDHVVFLMRGLPCCGKSFTAKRLAGTAGVVYETDAYFYSEVGNDLGRFDYRADLMPTARAWCFENFQKAIRQGLTPIVVDRGNSRSLETRKYAEFAIDHGYRVEIREPDSEWWAEIRVLLKYKDLTWPVLEQWADQLARWSRATHRVPKEEILRRMKSWRHGLTLKDILSYESKPKPPPDHT